MPPNTVENLFVLSALRPGRHYLVGNSHTFPGRIAAWHEDGYGLSISKSEISEMSETAAAWIDGFLAGSEPGPPDESDSVRVLSWEQAFGALRDTGELPRGNHEDVEANTAAIETSWQGVTSQDDFAQFLAGFSRRLRPGSFGWTDIQGESLLLSWATWLSPESTDFEFGFDPPDRIDADWRAIAKGLARAWRDG